MLALHAPTNCVADGRVFSFLYLLCVLFPEHITKTTVGVAYTWSHVVNTHF